MHRHMTEGHTHTDGSCHMASIYCPVPQHAQMSLQLKAAKCNVSSSGLLQLCPI